MAKRLFKKSFTPKQGENKYRNKKVKYDGYVFDSIRERDRYKFLKIKESEGIISCLTIKPNFMLIPGVYEEQIIHLKTKDKTVRKCIQRAIKYIGDFQYIKDGRRVVEDVKINPKLIPKEYKLKEKMMYAIHKIKIKRVYNPSEDI